jgi:hypothetical protein
MFASQKRSESVSVFVKTNRRKVAKDIARSGTAIFGKA